MESVPVPSSSAFLSASPLNSTAESSASKPRSNASTRAPASKKDMHGEAVAKPKQSKSRNGCLTCKAKRLKCDETKPSCQQCHKRRVVCGGYKKDFKWRPFEETTVANKAIPSTKKRNSTPGMMSFSATAPTMGSPKSDTSTPSFSSATPRMPEYEGLFPINAPSPPPLPMSHSMPDLHFDHPPFFDMSTPPHMRELPRPRFDRDNSPRGLNSFFEDVHRPPPSPRPSQSGQSPRLIDLLLPGSELNARPGTVVVPPVTPPLTLSPLAPPLDSSQLPDPSLNEEDDVEEIIRRPPVETSLWTFQGPPNSPAHSTTPSMSSASLKMYRQPEVQAGSPESLMVRFDKQTCGILSVKDGPTENPWRTLVWPLARDSPALYHAIASMTAFHACRDKLALRLSGMEHMRNSIRNLATGIDKMRTDTALATTLVLAFAESWDQHISTGIEHLRGAKILVKQALTSHKKHNVAGDDLARLRFLCNTWIYMDVIARLTSIDDDEGNDFDSLLGLMQENLFNGGPEIDPLMGCATTLFPLIGRAASLCRRVRKNESNPAQIIAQANGLKRDLEQWLPQPGSTFERPEDPSSEIQHALHTAEAYRYATLLYLHQAVPEIPSMTSSELARKVLTYIACVPTSSRLVIVQIYPLLAAGCEVNDKEDRWWVEERWQSMANRMLIGNIDRCWEVMQEVWLRRDLAEPVTDGAAQSFGMMLHSQGHKRKVYEMTDDVFENDRAKKQRHDQGGRFTTLRTSESQAESAIEVLDPDMTVRGRLHWAGVMKDWGWEILLG